MKIQIKTPVTVQAESLELAIASVPGAIGAIELVESSPEGWDCHVGWRVFRTEAEMDSIMADPLLL